MKRADFEVLGRLKGRWENEWVTLYPYLDEGGDIIKYEKADADPHHKAFYDPVMVELFRPIDFNDIKLKLVENILPTIIARGDGNKNKDVKNAIDYADEVIKKIFCVPLSIR